jgi:exosortase
VVFFLGLLAFLFLPTRLVEAATPEWRPLQWLLASEVIGLTLGVIYLAGGKGWLRQAAFPICFFFVAIPWPTPIEQPIIQGLSRMNAALVVEVLGCMGVPAMQHGNVIEVSTGMVGINDACSGIRSLQSSLMISLFFGEFYLLRRPFRLCFVGLGFILAMGCNLFRASLLAWIAAKQGTAAISSYHDEAGLTIVVACALALWGVGSLLSRRRSAGVPPAGSPSVSLGDGGRWAAGQGQKMEGGGRRTEDGGRSNSQPSTISYQPINWVQSIKPIAISLILWLAVVETGVELWYHIRESHLQPGPAWTVNLPERDATFVPLPLNHDEHTLLRFDEAKQGQWQESDGTTWQVYYFNWRPGRVAGYLAKRHTPDICLSATGMKMLSGPILTGLDIHGVYLPMRSYVFQGPAGTLQVFQCHWEAGVKSAYAAESSRFNLIRGIWAGRGNQGQKVLEIIITGYDDPGLAKQALARQLDRLIKIEEQEKLAQAKIDLP